MLRWLGAFALVVVLVALHLGVLWRALAREEDSVQRAVHAELRDHALALQTQLDAELVAAERLLEERGDAPRFASAVRRGDDGTTEIDGHRDGRATPACDALGIALPTTKEAERPALVARILQDCPLARGASGALLVPSLAAAKLIAPDAWSAWQAAHHDPSRALEGVVDALAQRAAREHDAPLLSIDVPQGRIRVRREPGAYRGFVVTPASLVHATAKLERDDLMLRLDTHPSGTFHEPVLYGPFTLALVLDDPRAVAARSARSRALVVGLSLASLVLALGTSFFLLARMRRLRRESELRIDFVAAVSHELRTPLASIRLLSEVLRREDLPEAERAAAFDSLDESATTLETQAERWLTLARLGKGLAARRTAGNLAAVVRRAAKDLPVDAPDDVPFSFDPFLVELVVDNLLANAAKYGQPPVHLAVKQHPMRIVCTDHGPGFPADAERLLQPFERGDLRLHHATKGMGLGLSLIAGAARAHGGRVILHDATVTVTLEPS